MRPFSDVTGLSLTDVVPALEGLDQHWMRRLMPDGARPDIRVEDLPACACVAEFELDGCLRPAMTVHLAGLIADHPQLSAVPLASLVPDLARVSARLNQIALDDSQARLLATAGISRWWSLADWSFQRLNDKLARSLAIRLVAAAIRLAATHALRPAGSWGSRENPTAADLEILATWARHELALESLGEALEASAAAEYVPTEVAEAVARVRAFPLSDLGRPSAPQYDLATSLRRLLACDARSRLILERRIYSGPDKLTLDELGSKLGVTRERIRQIETQLKKNIRALLDSGQVDVVLRSARRLEGTLGACCALDNLPETAAWASGVHPTPDPETELHARVLLDLAGPYVVHERWLVREHSHHESVRAIGDRLRDGLIPLAETGEILSGLGIPTSEHRAWLEIVCGCRVIEDTVLPWKGSMADKTEALMQLRGVPLLVDEIAQALGPRTNARSMINQIQSDPRFLRRGLKLYGLRRWGGEEYTTIQDEIEQEVERQGGAASLDHLVETLCEQFGVSESSVRAYASCAPFVRTRDGVILLGTGQAAVVQRPIEDCRGCVRVGIHWALRVLVDGELLRGSGRPVPLGVPQHLGLKPGESRHLATPDGALLLRYGRQPTIGSLRKAATRLGCVVGDRLFVIFAQDAAVECSSVPATVVEPLTGVERLARELGADADAHPIAASAYALGLPPDEYSPSAIRRRLVARKEDDLLPLVADLDIDENDDDVLEQLIGLGE